MTDPEMRHWVKKLENRILTLEKRVAELETTRVRVFVIGQVGKPPLSPKTLSRIAKGIEKHRQILADRREQDENIRSS